MERSLESDLILQEIRPVFRSQGVIKEDILLVTQRAAADQRERAQDLSKRLSKVNRVVCNPSSSS